MKTYEELQQEIKQLHQERQELQIQVDDLGEANHALRCRVQALESENTTIKKTLKNKTYKASPTYKASQTNSTKKPEVFRMKYYTPPAKKN